MSVNKKHKAWNDMKTWLEDMSRRERERDEIVASAPLATELPFVLIGVDYAAPTDEDARRRVEGDGHPD